MGLDGELYYTVNNPNPDVTIGNIDAKTGEVTYLKVDRKDGKFAATAEGITRDDYGNLWFEVNRGRRSLGKLDMKTKEISVYETPEPMSPLSNTLSLDVDGKGRVWASILNGATVFDPATEKFTPFTATMPFKNTGRADSSYGAVVDREGNGWWDQMGLDTLGKADTRTGQTIEVRLPPIKKRLPETQRAFYENFSDRTDSDALPWAQGPRRIATDKNSDVLWVGNSWGSTLARFETNTGRTSTIPLPNPTYQPDHIAVDQNHNVWSTLRNADRLAKYDPAKGVWTTFNLPTRGTEVGHVSLLDRGGVTKVIVPIYSKMGVMTLRSEADIGALKAATK
jgi:streptogramin lyase